MRKTIPLLLPALALFVLLCSACDSNDAAPASPSAAPTQAASASASLPAAPAEPQVLTIARVENNRFVTDTINTFNESNAGYTLESQWYNNREGELKLALAAGDGPALMSLDHFDYQIYAAKGVFQNLYPYLDNDPALSRSDLVESVLHALQETDDTLYQIAPTYHLDTVFTCPDAVDPALPWNLDTIEQWMKAHPEALFAADTSELLEVLLRGSLSSLVDYETMTCDFTSGLFTRLLTDVSNWSRRPNLYGEADAAAYSSRAMLCSWMYLRNFSDYQLAADTGLTTASGFPSESGNGVYIGSVVRFAICAGSGQEDAAWEFIKSTLSSETQAQVPWFPLLRSALEAQAQEARQETPPTVTTQFIDPAEAATGQNQTIVTVTLPPAAGMDTGATALVLDLIGQASGFWANSSPEIMGIIYEESAACFSGDRSPEDTAEIIQNRVSLYLSENQ